MRWVTLFCLLCIGSLSATWSPPFTIGEADEKVGFPQIAVDANGNATAVWMNSDGINFIVQSSTKPFGGSWQASPDNLSLPGQNADNPQIAVDANGNATAVWERYNGINFIIQSSTKPFGGSWQASPDNLSLPGQDSSISKIAVDANGNATAVWQRYNGSNWIIQSSTKPFGGSWQASPDNLSLPGQDSLNPRIAVDANGNATVVWVSNETIQSSTKLFGGSWQAIPDNVTQPGLIGDNPQIAVDGNGDATAVWAEYIESTSIIRSSTKPFGGSWQASPDSLSQSGQNSYSPQIAVDINGNATAVWSRFDGSNWIIQSSTKPFGGSWQALPNNLSQPGQSARIPQIAVDTNGNATAVWSRYNGSNLIVQSSTKPFGEGWQVPPNDLSQSGQNSNFPQIAIDPYGNATVVWVMSSPSLITAYIQSSTNFFGPTVTHVVPSSGTASGGNSVTITGTDFVDVTSVLFGSTPATSFTVESPTTIIAIVPPGAGVVDIRVIAASMTSPSVVADQYTYQPTSPTHFRGEGKHHKKKLCLKAKWRKSSSSVVRYEIFARDQRIEIISASRKPKSTIHLNPRHRDHLTKKYRKYLHDKYKIRAVDSFGTPSLFTHIKVKR